MKKAAVLIMFALLFPAIARAQITNGSFEKTRILSGKEAESMSAILKSRAWKVEDTIVFPAGWKINIANTRNGEYRLVNDPSQASEGNVCIYIKGHFSYTNIMQVNAGDQAEISFDLKDPDQKNATIYLYCYGKSDEGKTIIIGGLNYIAAARPEWTRNTWKLTLPEAINGKKLHAVVLALSSVTGTYFDNVEMKYTKTENKIKE